MQRRKRVGMWLWGFCAWMSLSPVVLAADQPKEPVVSARATEGHLANIRQLTVGRQNAEAYFSFDGNKLIFQSTNNWMKDSSASPRKTSRIGAGVLSNVRDGCGKRDRSLGEHWEGRHDMRVFFPR